MFKFRIVLLTRFLSISSCFGLYWTALEWFRVHVTCCDGICRRPWLLYLSFPMTFEISPNHHLACNCTLWAKPSHVCRIQHFILGSDMCTWKLLPVFPLSYILSQCFKTDCAPTKQPNWSIFCRYLWGFQETDTGLLIQLSLGIFLGWNSWKYCCCGNFRKLLKPLL